jgi:hypothetical protein
MGFILDCLTDIRTSERFEDHAKQYQDGCPRKIS